MHLNEIRIASEKDFEEFHSLVTRDDEWHLKYEKHSLSVHSKWTAESRIKMMKVFQSVFFSLISYRTYVLWKLSHCFFLSGTWLPHG